MDNPSGTRAGPAVLDLPGGRARARERARWSYFFFLPFFFLSFFFLPMVAPPSCPSQDP